MSTPDARERILLAAERMIADRGLHVSLREIALAAGQRNNSAVHYHFGNRDDLVGAVIDYRMALLEQRRLELLAEHEATVEDTTVRDLVAMLAEPMLDLLYDSTATHYARFLEAVRGQPAITDRTRLNGADRAAVRVITARLDRLLPYPPQTRRRRLGAMATAMFALLADLERDRENNHAPDRAAATEDVVDMLTGLLTAHSDHSMPRTAVVTERSGAVSGYQRRA